MASKPSNQLFNQIKKLVKQKIYQPYYHTIYSFNHGNKFSNNQPLAPPVIVTGIYRSGTTLTTSIMERIGIDFGPQEHKCGGKGEFGYLNRSGFQENFLINDLGRYILHHAGGSGVKLPETKQLQNLDLNHLDDAEFAYYSEAILNDDRVEKKIRRDILTTYGISGINQYFSDYFNTACWGFKDVHAGAYLPTYHRMWPGSKIICVVREPTAFLQSALKLSHQASLATWVDYYQRVIEFEKQVSIHWIIYESLLEKNELVIRQLINFTKACQKVDDALVEDVLKLINPRSKPCNSEIKTGYQPAIQLYQTLKQKAEQAPSLLK